MEQKDKVIETPVEETLVEETTEEVVEGVVVETSTCRISSENFQEKWDYVSNKLIETKKKWLVEKIVAIVGNVMFFVLFSLVTFGFFYRLGIKSVFDFLNTQTLYIGGWKLIRPLAYHPDLHIALHIAIDILVVFIPIVIVTALIFGVVWYVYKPNTGRALSGNALEDSKNLYKMAIEVKARAKKAQIHASGMLTMLYMVEVFVLVVMYAYYCIMVIKDMSSLLGLLSIIFGQYGPTVIQLFLPVVGGVYILINTWLAYLLKLFYTTKFDETLIDDAKQYYQEVDPEIHARILEEEKILALAKEIEANRKKENEEFLVSNIIVENPMVKKLKLGARIATVVLVVGVLIWGFNTPAVKSLISYFTTETEAPVSTEEIDGTESTETTEIPEEIVK